MSIQVLIVEDEPVIAADIEMTLQGDDYHVLGIAHSSTRALDMIHRMHPDIVLLDIAIQGDKDGIDIAHILSETYKIPFIYITSFADQETLMRAKATLPLGYIVKPFKDRDIISTLAMAMYRHATLHATPFPSLEELQKHTSLTPAEYLVLQCVWEGMTNQQITSSLNITLNTVKTHLKNIFSKLQVSSRTEAIALVRKWKRQ
jgi:DNA-binding NarL/FixJ family response regulator